MADLKKKFEDLENKIQNLINSHQKLRSENETLREENVRLVQLVDDEKLRQKRVEEGFRELSDTQKSRTGKQITGLKVKVNEMISEIERSVALIDIKS